MEADRELAELAPVVVERWHVRTEPPVRRALDVDRPLGDEDRRPAAHVRQLHCIATSAGGRPPASRSRSVLAPLALRSFTLCENSIRCNNYFGDHSTLPSSSLSSVTWSAVRADHCARWNARSFGVTRAKASWPFAVARTSTPLRSPGFGSRSARPDRSSRSTRRVVSEARLRRPSATAPIGMPASGSSARQSAQSATYCGWEMPSARQSCSSSSVKRPAATSTLMWVSRASRSARLSRGRRSGISGRLRRLAGDVSDVRDLGPQREAVTQPLARQRHRVLDERVLADRLDRLEGRTHG